MFFDVRLLKSLSFALVPKVAIAVAKNLVKSQTVSLNIFGSSNPRTLLYDVYFSVVPGYHMKVISCEDSSNDTRLIREYYNLVLRIT